MKKLLFKLIVIAAVFALCGCKEEKAKQQAETTEQESIEQEIYEPQEFVLNTNINLPLIEMTQTKTQAHKTHLNDPMEFSPLPSALSDKTVVVGSSKCVLYKKARPKTDKDLKSLEKIESIPKGALLNITGEIIKAQGKEEYYNALFEFQDEWNWFYPVEYEGKEGIVFGADLCGFENTAEDTAILSLLYQSADKTSENAYFEKFYPICGYTKLSNQVSSVLTKYKIALQEVSQKEYHLNPNAPDDMVANYQNHRGSIYKNTGRFDITPLFITTDFFAHSQHLLFDQLLQRIEETILLPRLHSVAEDFIAEISADLESNPQNESAQKALQYFNVGKALLEFAGDADSKQSREEILSRYDEQVKAEIALIDEASGLLNSALFAFADGGQYKEDYSQYKPRGHYTKNETLKAYFRSMMWFGRINFTFPAPNAENDERLKLANDMCPIAPYITSIAANNGELYKKWNSVFDPMTVLIGQSDDISFNEMVPLWKSLNAGNALEWISKDENIKAFSEQAHENLTSPLIAGNSVFYANQSEGDLSNPSSLSPAMGWRFLGQRFTYDAWIFHEASSPRTYGRQMVTGRDIAAAFGSKTAAALLQDDFSNFEKLQPKLNGFEKLFYSQNADFWCQNYYNSVLASTKAQAEFEQGSGFYFTESPLWNIKSLEASLGTWAELKHDTILYTKQSYAEMGGGDGDMNPTYRVEKLPATVHYIEPNVNFFASLCNSLSTLKAFFSEYNLFDEKSQNALLSMEEIARKSLEIVKIEANNERVPIENLEWIAKIPWMLSRIVVPYFDYSTYVDDNDQFKMALVADVFTNAETQSVLEVAVGIPQRIYVALNDKQGGKRIAVGYIFNYYEFPHPMSDRLTDEQWKETVYKKPDSAKESKPSWLSPNAVLPATGFCK